MRTNVVVVTGVVVVLAALTGCSGGDKKPSAAGSTAAATSLQAKGAITSLKGAACKADAQGRWSLSGKVTNPAKNAQTYKVTASVVRNKGYAVVGSKVVTVKVPAGQTRSIAAANFATKVDKNLRCVIMATSASA